MPKEGSYSAPRAEFRADTQALIAVVGRSPLNRPYLRIESASGVYLGSIDGDDLVALRDAITEAVRRRNQ